MPSLKELLPYRLSSTPAWAKLADAVEHIFEQEVWSMVDKISELRDPRNIEKEFIGLLARYLGLHVKSTIFTEDQYRRVTEAIYEYYEECGTESLANILSFGQDIPIEIIPLWSNNYSNFQDHVPSGQGTVYDGTGDWYFTPHVEVAINVENGYRADNIHVTTGLLGTKYSNLGLFSLGNTQLTYGSFTQLFDESKIRELFYHLAPIQLVLERFTRKLTSISNLQVVAAATTRITNATTDTEPHLFVLAGTTDRVVDVE